jgi:hypothetical protein
VISGSLLTVIATGRSSPSLLRMRRVDSDIVLRNWLNSELAASFHLQAIDADILNIVVVPVIGVAADYARFVEEEDPVAAVEPEQRNQVEQIDVLIDDQPVGSALYRVLSVVMFLAGRPLFFTNHRFTATARSSESARFFFWFPTESV